MLLGQNEAYCQVHSSPSAQGAVFSGRAFRRKGYRARAAMAVVSAAEEQGGGIAESKAESVVLHALFFKA